jgi:hypothetical protein
MQRLQPGITTPRQQLSKIGFADFAFADFHQYAHQAPDHPPNEVRRFNAKLNNVVLRFDFRTRYIHDSRFMRPRRVQRTEANKVVSSGKCRRTPRHASTSSGSFTHQTNFLVNACFRREI